jgi:hypothetical protein
MSSSRHNYRYRAEWCTLICVIVSSAIFQPVHLIILEALLLAAVICVHYGSNIAIVVMLV